MDENPYDPPRQSNIDPKVGTEREPTIGGWGDLFMTRVALAAIVLFWVAFLVAILWWFIAL
jgi:hypothetical protein